MAVDSLHEIWVYLATSPLLGLTITLAVYLGCDWLYKISGGSSLLNPVLLSIILLVSLLAVTDTPYDTYFAGAQFVHFLLGPATVALAFPLYSQIGKLRMLWPRILLSVCAGGALGSISAVWIADVLGADRGTILSLAPKSVTAPVGMGIAEKVGGLPTLTGVLVVTTGILGAVCGPKLFDLLKVSSNTARGIAIGVTSHGIGTARALQLNQEMGAFSGLAMALTALFSSFALPGLLYVMGYIE